MKHIILSAIVALLSFSSAWAQNCDVAFGVYFDNNKDLTEQNQNYLRNIINRASVQGLGVASLEDSQLAIVVKTDIVDKHVIAGAPTKIVLNLSMTFYLANVADGKVFSQWSTDVNGVGNSDGKAFNNAIHKITPQNREFASFISQAKEDVINYYNRNYTNIIKKAHAEASMYNYEEALYQLMCIPECCVGYDKAMAEVRVIFQAYVDRQCQENLGQARAVWLAGYTPENARLAGSFLAEIYPDAACYSEAMALAKDIQNHAGEEWKFKMKQWDDLASIESQRMRYAREIALAWAQNQPKTVIHFPY